MKSVIIQLANELDLHPCTLYNWLGSYRFDKFRFAESAGTFNINKEFYETFIKFVSLRKSKKTKSLIPKLIRLKAKASLE